MDPWTAGCCGAQLLSGSLEPAALSSARPEQPLQLNLTSSELMACESWAEQIRAWGWELAIDNLAGHADVARIPVVLGKPLTINDLQVGLWCHTKVLVV